jgi:hypothetical protein
MLQPPYTRSSIPEETGFSRHNNQSFLDLYRGPQLIKNRSQSEAGDHTGLTKWFSSLLGRGDTPPPGKKYHKTAMEIEEEEEEEEIEELVALDII